MTKSSTPKPRYNLLQNSGYMISTAWKSDNKSVIWLCIVTAALAMATSLLALFVTPAILRAVEARVPLSELITLILIFVSAMLIVGALSSYVQTNTWFGRSCIRSSVLLTLINDKVSKTSYPNIGNQDFWKKLRRTFEATNSNHSSTEAIWSTLTDLLKNTMGLVIYLVLLATLTPWVIALVLATTITGFFITRYVNGWEFRNKSERDDITNRLWYANSQAEDKSLAKDIRLFGMGPWLNDVYNSSYRALKAFVGRRERFVLIGSISDVVLSFVRNGVAYIYLIGLVIGGELSAPEFLLLFTAIGGFTTWVSGVLTEVNTLHRYSLEISNLREVLEYPDTFTFEEGLPLTPESGKLYQLELVGVSFRYPEAENDILTNINLTIKPGEKLAIVGLNGAGKTTLVKLLSGLLDPTKGVVKLNGQDIRQYNRRDYYRHFTAVFQEHSIFPVGIDVNISQAIPGEIDMKKVQDCATHAGLDEKIKTLSQGYQTPLTKDVYYEGIDFSGGETQRLLLARALYKDAPIIILDEPTAALDPIAESEMYEKYHQLTANRTSLYISHRLASTRFCDRVMFVDDGAIKEEGTHEELINQKGRYAELFDIQSQYYV